ncbi:lambda exonuclease family protein [Halomonas daqiaonensis]|uniref:YqaJ-like recombinase domain-containing protein n=1 Tax=Halomonas daqiaonensis TaxID=650850 RepID=A0A1H7VAE1_9GAMM|nr:lambda exonuclease family protein [Halomonas daqiaonensis]SEM06251.1 YqaJ-like recombinase domain-containing protein [Halomonas daqiaonensis]
MQILTLEQGTPEWHAARLGIVTMSELKTLLVKGKGPSGFGAGALSYMHQLIGERITGEPSDVFQGNGHTQRGHELEPVARELYQEATGLPRLEQVGIILNHGVGYSPDCLVDSRGLVEIKTKLPKYQIELLLEGELPQEHVAQCQGGLWVSEREWIDFVSYWPGMPLFVKRAYRDEAMIRTIAERVEAFYAELERRMALVMAA